MGFCIKSDEFLANPSQEFGTKRGIKRVCENEGESEVWEWEV